MRAEPHHLVFSSGRWYLIAWDLDRDEWRVFRVDRMATRISTGPRFAPRTVPGGDVHEFLAARFKGTDRNNVWPCIGEVILETPARKVIPFVSDGTVEELAPDRCRLTIGSWSWVALASSIARFDAPIAQVAPQELAEALGKLSERLGAAAQTQPVS